MPTIDEMQNQTRCTTSMSFCTVMTTASTKTQYAREARSTAGKAYKELPSLKTHAGGRHSGSERHTRSRVTMCWSYEDEVGSVKTESRARTTFTPYQTR